MSAGKLMTEPLGTQLRRQRLRLGLTLDELATRTGISKPYLSLIETGRVANPPSDGKLATLEQTLGFSAGQLIGQAHLLRTPADVRTVLLNLMRSGEKKFTKRKISEPQPGVMGSVVPVINRLSAGYPKKFDDLNRPPRGGGEMVGCPDLRDAKAFAVRVADDSMSPRFGVGDIVIFSPALRVRTGDDCFVRFADGQTTFRRVFFEINEEAKAHVRLQPRNQTRPPRIVGPEKIAGMHRAAFRYERLDRDEPNT